MDGQEDHDREVGEDDGDGEGVAHGATTPPADPPDVALAGRADSRRQPDREPAPGLPRGQAPRVVVEQAGHEHDSQHGRGRGDTDGRVGALGRGGARPRGRAARPRQGQDRTADQHRHEGGAEHPELDRCRDDDRMGRLRWIGKRMDLGADRLRGRADPCRQTQAAAALEPGIEEGSPLVERPDLEGRTVGVEEEPGPDPRA